MIKEVARDEGVEFAHVKYNKLPCRERRAAEEMRGRGKSASTTTCKITAATNVPLERYDIIGLNGPY